MTEGGRMERKVVTTIRWKFSGGGGMEHAYLVVSGLTITHLSEKTGELYFWAHEYDDGRNVPNERSMETVRDMVQNLEKQVQNGTFLSLEKSQAINNDPFKLVFELPNGVHFIDHAVYLSFLIFQIFDLRIRGHHFYQVSIKNSILVRESPDTEFVDETILLRQQLNRALEPMRR